MLSNLYQRAAGVMVRETVTLRQALSRLGDDSITNAEAAELERSQEFQKCLWAERHRFYKELATAPGFGKESLVGQGLLATNKLIEAGQWDKALEGILKLAKILGIAGADQNTNVVLNLTQKDLNEMREKLAAKTRK